MNSITVKKLHTFLGHNDSLYTLEKTGNKTFLSAGADGMIVHWNLETPDEGEVVAKVPGSIFAMKYDATSQHIFVGQNNQGIHKIDLSTKIEERSINLGDHQIFDIQLIGDDLWVGLQTGEVVILSKDLQVISRKKLGNDRVRSIQQHNGQVAIGFSDNLIRIYALEKEKLVRELKGHKNSVFKSVYHPSGKYLASVGRDAHIKVWDTQEDFVLRESIPGHLYTINDLVFRNDGRYFVTAGMDKAIKLWDAYNFKLLKVLDKHRHAGHGNSVNRLLWMDYQDLLVSCSDDRSISIWELSFEE